VGGGVRRTKKKRRRRSQEELDGCFSINPSLFPFNPYAHFLVPASDAIIGKRDGGVCNRRKSSCFETVLIFVKRGSELIFI